MANEEQFLKKRFQQYYSGKEVPGPPEISQREFGIGTFGRKISNRHLAFATPKEFNSFLREQVPFYASYSPALYKHPARRPMEAKEMAGADLVYEFDADDIQTECKQRHDSWQCPKCGKQGKGRQLNCDECGSPTRLEEWFCRECLETTKQKVFALLEFLEKDFGFTEGIKINFSGRAGYHVHVRSDSARGLSHAARIELTDYLTATGLNIFSHFKKEDTLLKCPALKEKVGWPQRILFELAKVLEEANPEKIATMGNIQLSTAKRLLKNRATVMKSITERQTIPSLFGKATSKTQSKSDLFWQNFLNSIVAKIAPIDRQTSIDINKIVRVPETLHGETGMNSKELTAAQLKKFSPFDQAIAFPQSETVKVFINKAPRFYLAGKSFGPFEKQETELPAAAAVFLIARGAASLGENQ